MFYYAIYYKTYYFYFVNNKNISKIISFYNLIKKLFNIFLLTLLWGYKTLFKPLDKSQFDLKYLDLIILATICSEFSTHQALLVFTAAVEDGYY